MFHDGAVKILTHFPTGPWARHLVRLLVQQRHVLVAVGPPLALLDVLEPRGDEHEDRPAVGKGALHMGTPADLAAQALDGVVGADTAPALAGEGRVRHGLGEGLADDPSCLPESHPVELFGDREGLGHGGFARPKSVDRLEHGCDGRAPGLRCTGEYVAVEVRSAALAGGLEEHLGDRADHAGRLVPDDYPQAVQSAGPQPGQEVPPALRQRAKPSAARSWRSVPTRSSAFPSCRAFGESSTAFPAGLRRSDPRFSSLDAVMGSGMADLRCASCRERSNRTEAGSAPFYLDAILLI